MYWVMAILPFVLLLLGFPIFLLLLATSLVILLFFFDLPMAVVHQDIFNSLNKYALLAVPFFVFAGDLMSRGGISNRLLRWVASMIGGFREETDDSARWPSTRRPSAECACTSRANAKAALLAPMTSIWRLL